MRVCLTSVSQQVYDLLLESLGPQHWWPGESPLEVMIGAILVQNTAWKNVERAIGNLRDENLIDVERLLEEDADVLAEIIRPAGYFRLKTKRLKSLMRYVSETYSGSLTAMAQADLRQGNAMGDDSSTGSGSLRRRSFNSSGKGAGRRLRTCRSSSCSFMAAVR